MKLISKPIAMKALDNTYQQLLKTIWILPVGLVGSFFLYHFTIGSIELYGDHLNHITAEPFSIMMFFLFIIPILAICAFIELIASRVFLDRIHIRIVLITEIILFAAIIHTQDILSIGYFTAAVAGFALSEFVRCRSIHKYH